MTNSESSIRQSKLNLKRNRGLAWDQNLVYTNLVYSNPKMCTSERFTISYIANNPPSINLYSASKWIGELIFKI